ncbi:Uncharacterised protein [Porphyromonas crevioricanis]|uniref:Uncharacterized protein n=1 Tax=Porphyromonas crevioricanis TaxID=393921 RepID=A0A2X4PEP1_9PORP|nr:hypothetical protein SAMN02745203_00819 [Porphyromonas crevioricanis]SQH72356.1 Uncharacterised protein [Porphyromonas crevioricanis]
MINANPSTLSVVVPNTVIKTASDNPIQHLRLKIRTSNTEASQTESTMITHHESRHLQFVSLAYLLFFS